MSRIVVYSGPSCVGKGPLRAVLEECFPQYRPIAKGGIVGKPILYVSREPRLDKGESEGNPYYFRTVIEIQDMVDEDRARYIAGWIRGNEQFQALDLLKTRELLQQTQLVLLEIYGTLGAQLVEPHHIEYLGKDIQTMSIFISPLSADELNKLKARGADLSSSIERLMLRKLERRDDKKPEQWPNRASWAYKEMKHAHKYAHVIPNHDGEDSDNWGLPHHRGDNWGLAYPIGDAKKTLEIFVELLETGKSDLTEHWPGGLL